MPIKTFAAACLALILAACNPMEKLEVAEAEIAQFHEVYNTGDAAALYEQTGEEFRSVTTPEQMGELVELVTDKMGAVESTERSGFNINSDTDETLTTVTMTTAFAKGEGVETFTFYGSGDDLRLVGWNVDSPNFLEEGQVPDEAVTEPEPAE